MSVFNELDLELNLMNRLFQNNFSCNLASASSKCPKMSIQALLNKFNGILYPNLGRVKGVKVNLTRKPDIAPKCFKARPILYAQMKKLKEEILHLLEEGILEPVKKAEFAAPNVPVLKQDQDS